VVFPICGFSKLIVVFPSCGFSTHDAHQKDRREEKIKTIDFFKLIYYTDNIYKVHRDKLQNCSCNQFHYIGTYKQVEKNNMTKNRGGNNGSEEWIEKTLRL